MNNAQRQKIDYVIGLINTLKWHLTSAKSERDDDILPALKRCSDEVTTIQEHVRAVVSNEFSANRNVPLNLKDAFIPQDIGFALRYLAEAQAGLRKVSNGLSETESKLMPILWDIENDSIDFIIEDLDDIVSSLRDAQDQ